MNYEKEFFNMPALPAQRIFKYGELASPLNGRVFSEPEVDAYNRYTSDFNQSNWRPTQELILDNRNKFFKSCAERPII